jgi:hypothetical protein
MPERHNQIHRHQFQRKINGRRMVRPGGVSLQRRDDDRHDNQQHGCYSAGAAVSLT